MAPGRSAMHGLFYMGPQPERDGEQESELSSTTKRKDVKSVEREVRVYQELTGGVGVNVDQNMLCEFSKN